MFIEWSTTASLVDCSFAGTCGVIDKETTSAEDFFVCDAIAERWVEVFWCALRTCERAAIVKYNTDISSHRFI